MISNPFQVRAIQLPLETVRGLAITLVVFYHVVGPSPASGLRLPEGSPLLTATVVLDVVHMPLFACLAGLVYAMKPVQPGRFGAFMLRKFRRLAVPGLAALAVFVVLAWAVPTSFDPPRPLWRAAVYPYAHFWFLQAILVVFAVAALLDLGLGRAGAVLGLVLGIALFASGWAPTNLMSLDGAIRLFPYFCLGQVIWHGLDHALARRWEVVAGGAAAVTLGLSIGAAGYAGPGSILAPITSSEGLLISCGTCIMALFALPRVRWLAWLGPPAFVIYLYHPVATSASRRLLNTAGVDSVPLHIAAGMVAGVGAPCLLYIAARWLRLRGISQHAARSPT